MVDERSRLQLADAAKQAFGDDAGITLMELLPPVGWADVATKHDLLALDARFDTVDRQFDALERRMEVFERRMDAFDDRMGRFEADLRSQTWKLMTLMIAVVGVVVAAVRL